MTSVQAMIESLIPESVLGRYMDRISIRSLGSRKVEIVAPEGVVKEITGVSNVKVAILVARITRSSYSRVLRVEGEVVHRYGPLKKFTRYLSTYDGIPHSINSLLENVSSPLTKKMINLIENAHREGYEIHTGSRELRRENIVIRYNPFYPRDRLDIVVYVEYESKIPIPMIAFESLIEEMFKERYKGRMVATASVNGERDGERYRYCARIEVLDELAPEVPSLAIKVYEKMKKFEKQVMEKRQRTLTDTELGVLAITLIANSDDITLPPEVSDHLHTLLAETGRVPREILVEAEERFGDYTLVGIAEKIGAVLDPEDTTLKINNTPLTDYLRKYFGEDADTLAKTTAEKYLLRKYGELDNPFKKMREDGVLTHKTVSVIIAKQGYNIPLDIAVEVWDILTEEQKKRILTARPALDLVELWKTNREQAKKILSN